MSISKTRDYGLWVIIGAVLATGAIGYFAKQGRSERERLWRFGRNRIRIELTFNAKGINSPPVSDPPDAPMWASASIAINGKPLIDALPFRFEAKGKNAKGQPIVMGTRWDKGQLYVYPVTGYIHSEGPVSVSVTADGREVGQTSFPPLPDEKPLFKAPKVPERIPGVDLALSRNLAGQEALSLSYQAKPARGELIAMRIVGSDYHWSAMPPSQFWAAAAEGLNAPGTFTWTSPYLDRAKAVRFEAIWLRTVPEKRTLRLSLVPNPNYSEGADALEPKVLVAGLPSDWLANLQEYQSELRLNLRPFSPDFEFPIAPLYEHAIVRTPKKFVFQDRTITVSVDAPMVRRNPNPNPADDVRPPVVINFGEAFEVEMDLATYTEKYRRSATLPLDYLRLPIRDTAPLRPVSVIVKPGLPALSRGFTFGALRMLPRQSAAAPVDVGRPLAQ